MNGRIGSAAKVTSESVQKLMTLTITRQQYLQSGRGNPWGHAERCRESPRWQ